MKAIEIGSPLSTSFVLTFVFVVAMITLTGCATKEPPTMQEEVVACASDFMSKQAHVLDATKACSHIYGLKSSREPRSTELD